MAIWKIDFTEEVWKTTTIVADSWEEAREAFWNGDFDKEFVTGGEIQDSVEIEEVQ